MKSLNILHAVLKDASVSTGASTSRDWITIQSRHEHEGESFLTITLPDFCVWFERSIHEGQCETSIFSLFRKKRSKKIRSVLPCFLHGLTSLVFDVESGRIREDASVNAVLFVRQICLLHKKVKLPCTIARISKALTSSKEVDLSLKTSDRSMKISSFDRFCFDTLSKRILANYDLNGDFPKHGPGATVEKITANSKFKNRDYFERWEQVIGWEELYGFSTIHHHNYDAIIEPKHERPVKVTCVPKTLKSPRVIGVEPTAMQFAQQLVASRLIGSIDNSVFASNIRFTSQDANRSAALLGSKTQEFATIDLSEASDRVSCKLVREIFRSRKDVLKQLFAVRSTSARYPDGSVLKLRRYASMGSATTFPVEAVTFLVLALTAIAKERYNLRKRLYDRQGPEGIARLLLEVADKVLVFGDDIIVPRESCTFVCSYLESFGLKVNRKKTFYKGHFRESCGMDAFKGYEVTPTYIRTSLDADEKSSEWLSATVALANQFFLRGMWSVAAEVEKLLPSLPLVADTSPGLGLWHYTNAYKPLRFSEKKHEWQVRTYIVSSSKVSDEIDGYDAMLKCFIAMNRNKKVSKSSLSSCSPVTDHLAYSPKRYSTKLSTKWVTPY
jgi:hypothetical protein